MRSIELRHDLELTPYVVCSTLLPPPHQCAFSKNFLRRQSLKVRQKQSRVRDCPTSRTSEEVPQCTLKEVIQPQVPLRLPCYDFTPVADLAVGVLPLAVGETTSGTANSHGVTGGVYKARERIHRGMLIRDY